MVCCDRCMHRNICKYENGIRSYIDTYNLTGQSKKPENLKVNFECTKYQAPAYNIK